MKNTTTIKVYSAAGLTYFVRKDNRFAARLFQLGHILRRTGYRTQILEG